MKASIRHIITLLLLLLPTLIYAQPRVIFDTDIDSDVDDVGALATEIDTLMSGLKSSSAQ